MTSAHDPSLQAARQRVRAAYDPDLLAACGERLVETLYNHLRRVTSGAGPVLNWQPPETATDAAAAYLDRSHASLPGDAAAIADEFAERIRTVLGNGNNLHHPRYVGHQVPASIPLAALFDAVGSVTNQVMAIYEMGPWATAVERALIDRVGRQIGLNAGTFAGLITHGGSLANLTGLLTARNVALESAWEAGLHSAASRPVLLVHSDAHYGINRAAGVLGIGTDNVIRVDLDERRRIDPAALDRRLDDLQDQGALVVAVVACACATPIGAFDPLPEIAAVCQRHNVWLHVDAAHGGAAAFSPRHRHLVDGLELADSIVLDAHKMLFMPALCAFLFYKNREHRYEAFRQDAPYLFDPSAPGMAEYDSGMLTLECTKRAAALGLWGIWSLFGPELFANLVDVTFDTAHRFYERLKSEPDFEALHEPQCNIVAFRHIPERLRGASIDEIGALNRRIRRQLIESGEFYLVQTSLDGVGALRVTIINPLTELTHLEDLLTAIRRVAGQLA